MMTIANQRRSQAMLYTIAGVHFRERAVLDNPPPEPEASRLDDLADDCDVVAADILAGRRQP